MSKQRWGIAHVDTIENLPKKMTTGRAYFVESEGYIVIDYGNGPVIYGSRSNYIIQNGAPSEQLQDQINYLTDAVFNILAEIARLSKSYDSAINILAQNIAKLYPEEHSSQWQETAEITTGEILTTENGEQYTISNAYVDDGAIVLEVELSTDLAEYIASTIKSGDTIEFDGGKWDVSDVTVDENGQAIVVLELA